MKRILLPLLALLLISVPPADADVESGAVTYKHGDVELEGYLARPTEGGDEKRPGVLLVHAWRGHGDNIRVKARELAEQGYVAFALDMYGKGVLAKDNAEASGLATPFYKDPALMRARARAGLDILLGQPDVDPTRVAAIGFCFGGTAVLELARSGADIAGVVSFHGGLATSRPAEKGQVRAKILVAHGADDPLVPPEQFLGFWKEMQAAEADYQLLVLSGAVHAFTDPGAGDDKTQPVCYSETAHRRAFAALRRFFAEIL